MSQANGDTLSHEPVYPTDWHNIDTLAGIQCRTVSMDTYELRSKTHRIVVNKEGFDIYRSSDLEAFTSWCISHGIQSEAIKSINGI